MVITSRLLGLETGRKPPPAGKFASSFNNCFKKEVNDLAYFMRFGTRAEVQLDMVTLVRICRLRWIFVQHDDNLCHVVEL